jgi:uncharacterized protein YggT (Ycf19 family)
MGIVDFILNLAGLLLWLNWRAIKADPLGARKPATLLGALRRAGPQRFRRWHLLAAIGGLIFLRAIFYQQIGSAARWTGNLDLGVIVLSFRSEWFGNMLLFSTLSFGLALGVFYLWLLFLSLVAPRNSGSEPIRLLLRTQLGTIDRWSFRIKILLPLVVTGLLWWILSWLFVWLQIIPRPVSVAHRLEESLVIGLNSYLAWKFVVAALLLLQLLNTYIYFGAHPFWSYIGGTARILLKPLSKLPLRAGKVDFAPLVGIAIVFLIAELAERGLAALYERLPL